MNIFAKTRGGVKTAAGSETSLVSGNYHKHKEPVVMVMASKSAMSLEPLVFAGRRDAPPVIVKLSGIHRRVRKEILHVY